MLTSPFSPPSAATWDGGGGAATFRSVGVIGNEGSDGALVPVAFVAVTVNVTDCPSVSPGKRRYATLLNSSAETDAFAPVDAVTVYEATSDPPVSTGGLKVT